MTSAGGEQRAAAVPPGVAAHTSRENRLAPRRPELAHPERHTLPASLRKHLAGYALLLPACLLVLGTIAYPLLYTLWLSFTDARDFDGPGTFAGLTNYRALLSDSAFWEAARNTVVLSSITIVLELLLGVATALLLWWKFWGRSLVFLVVFVPWVFPAAFSAFAWYILFKPPFHTFYTLEAVRLKDTLEQALGPNTWDFATLLAFNVWRCSSFIAVFLLAGLNGIPRQLLEYARLESGSPWQQFRLVIVPLLRKFLVLGVLIALVITFMDYTTAYIETGGLIFQPLLGTEAYVTSIIDGNTGLGAAMTAIQLPVIALLLFFAFRAFERAPATHMTEPAAPVRNLPARPRALKRDATAGPPRAPRRHFRLRRRTLAIAGGIAAFMVAAFHLLPIYWTVIQAIRPIAENVDGNPFWAQHPDIGGFTEAVGNRAFWTWMGNTGVVFGGALVLALGTSLLAGYALARLHVPGSRWIARLLLASYFIPPIAVLVPVYQLFLWLRIDDSFLAVILLYQTLTIPFCTWLFYCQFETLPPDTEEAALLDGNRAQAFLQMTLRMSWPVIIAAGVFSVGMMASDLLYAGTFLIHHDQQTVTVGLAIVSLDLGEFSQVTGGIGLAALPLVLVCLLFAPGYVRGLTMAMDEGA